MVAVQRSAAAAGSALFFALAPGTVAGLLPWTLTRWHAGVTAWPPARVLGVVMLVAGAAFLIHAFARFVLEGIGTPSPTAPPTHLVVGGIYRYVRNPMYLAVITTVLGQALLLWRPVLLGYAVLLAAAMVAFVVGYEQPALTEKFGEEYSTYRRAVPGWWPRLTPWRPDADGGHR
jgi:protein-S-isoprenylcysteine O-methyltransferase Ste14